MKDKLLAFITEHPRCSFHEIERFFEENEYDYKGEYDIGPVGYENISCWYGWTETACRLILDLLENGQVYLEIADEGELRRFPELWTYPKAKSLRSYKSERWLPVVILSARQDSPD